MDLVLLRKKPVGRISVFELARIGVGEILGRAVFLKERARDLIDAHVGALRGKDGGDQQLKGIVVFEGASHRRGRLRRAFARMARDALGSGAGRALCFRWRR